MAFACLGFIACTLNTGRSGRDGVDGIDGRDGAPGPTGPAGAPDDRAAILTKLAATPFMKRLSLPYGTAKLAGNAQFPNPSSGANSLSLGASPSSLGLYVELPDDVLANSTGTFRVIVSTGDSPCTAFIGALSTPAQALGSPPPAQDPQDTKTVVFSNANPIAVEFTRTGLQPSALLPILVGNVDPPGGFSGVECGSLVLYALSLQYPSATP